MLVMISASRKNWLLFILVAALSCGGLAKEAANADSGSASDFDGDDSRRSLVREFFALVAASTEDQEVDRTTTTADSTATASPNAEFAQECPLHDDDQDVFYCADPSLTYEIPCLAETCQWDLSFLDSTAPPGLCALIQLDEEKLSTGRIPDTLKPCVLWESLFGTLFQPTASPTQPTFCKSILDVAHDDDGRIRFTRCSVCLPYSLYCLFLILKLSSRSYPSSQQPPFHH